MRTRTARTGAAWVLTTGLLAGCESAPRHTPYSDNPLLQARQPLLQSPGAPPTDGTQVAQSGPRMVVVPPPGLYQQPPAGVAAATPAVPTFTAPKPTYPSAGSALPAATQTAATVPAREPAELSSAPVAPPAPLPVAAVTAPSVEVPAVAPAAEAIVPPPAVPPPVTQVVVRTAEGRYGHVADYTWLQGELDRHYRGHLELRYRPVSEDDPYGGKVRLEDDPLLAEFRPGDVIAVEGELLTDPDGPAAAPWAQYKRFHVRAVRLVERK